MPPALGVQSLSRWTTREVITMNFKRYSFSILVSSGYMPRNGIAGSYGGFIPSFLRNLHTVFLEKAMATHSSTLAWKIPRTEEPDRLQSLGSLRVGHD